MDYFEKVECGTMMGTIWWQITGTEFGNRIEFHTSR